MSEHVSLPFSTPDLSSLTDEQLTALRKRVVTVSRDYRRKANSSIGKIELLRKSWNRMLGMNGSTPMEERTEIMQTFEKELLPYPDVYLSHAMANALVLLDGACRDEGLRRSPAGAKTVRRRS